VGAPCPELRPRRRKRRFMPLRGLIIDLEQRIGQGDEAMIEEDLLPSQIDGVGKGISRIAGVDCSRDHEDLRGSDGAKLPALALDESPHSVRPIGPLESKEIDHGKFPPVGPKAWTPLSVGD
jgi:hypothetical protein